MSAKHRGHRMAAPRYRETGPGHVLLNRSRSGDRAVLEDRSIWKLDPGEGERTRRWPQWTRVRVQPAGGNAYWLIGEVLGSREPVLAVFAGYLARPESAAKSTPPPPEVRFDEPEL